jgi:hypothetical protein
MRRRTTVALHAAAAATVSLVTGWSGARVVLCIIAPLLLVRFVWLDRETTMLGAMTFTALLAVMGLSQQGPSGAVTVALGGFVAAELAARGARVRRSAPLPRLRGDLFPTVGVIAAAATTSLGALAVTRWAIPAALGVASLALLVTGLFVVVLTGPDPEETTLGGDAGER